MPEPADTAPRTIPVYTCGQWNTKPFPITETDDYDDYDRFKRANDWHEFTSLNDGNSSLNLEIWHGKPQHGEVRFLIEVCSPSAVFTVGAVDAADMMDLVTRWAPTVQAAAVTDLCREMDFGQAVNTNMETNRVAAIGALMAEGSAQRESWEARAVRRTQERLAAARARRESGQ